MIVVSVYDANGGWPEHKDKRKYYDVCSMKCLAAFANSQPSIGNEKEGR
jgi:hypothetical protein